MSLPGTPDWQRGIATPQKLVGHLAAGNKTITVPVPPNTESLVIYSSSGSNIAAPQVLGLTTNTVYPVVPYATSPNGDLYAAWVATVSSVVDSQVTVSWGSNVPSDVYIVSDQGIRASADVTLAELLTIVGDTGSKAGIVPYVWTPNGWMPEGQGQSTTVVPKWPTNYVTFSGAGTILGSPAGAAWYLFQAHWMSGGANGGYFVQDGGGNNLGMIGAYATGGNTTDHTDFKRLRVSNSVQVVLLGTAYTGVLLYGVGP